MKCMKYCFMGQIYQRIKLEIKQIKIQTYSMDLAISNECLKVIKLCLEPEIFNEKVEVLFVFILKNKTSTFPLNILGSKHYTCMMISKYSFDIAKSILYVSIFICFVSNLVLY